MGDIRRSAQCRNGLLLAAVFLCVLPLGRSAARAEEAGPGHCAGGVVSSLSGSADGVAQRQLVAPQPDAGPPSGGNQVTLNGAGLSTYT